MVGNKFLKAAMVPHRHLPEWKLQRIQSRSLVQTGETLHDSSINFLRLKFSLNERRSNLLCARHLIHFSQSLPSLSFHSETRYQTLPILLIRSQLIFRFHHRIAAVYSGATVARAGQGRYPLLIKYKQAPTSITVIGRTRTSGIGSDMERSGESGLWEMPNELESVARTRRRGWKLAGMRGSSYSRRILQKLRQITISSVGSVKIKLLLTLCIAFTLVVIGCRAASFMGWQHRLAAGRPSEPRSVVWGFLSVVLFWIGCGVDLEFGLWVLGETLGFCFDWRVIWISWWTPG